MEALLNRYRNITVLLLVIFAQLLLLAYQVKGNQDVRLIRIWAVTAVTPLARTIEGVRSGTVKTVESYILLHNLMDENRQIKSELGKLKLENQYLKSELETADRVRALSAFQSRSPSKMIAARIIGTGAGTYSKVDFVDRGTTSGVMKGMAVITPDGIVGRVIAAYPTASQVLMITDPTFAAGVISQKHRVYGTVKGQGHGTCIVDYVQNEQTVEPGEVFYTSGDDRVFPKGLPVGKVTVVRHGSPYKQIFLTPSGFQNGLEEVLVVLEGVHGPVPEPQSASHSVYLMPPATPESPAAASSGGASPAAPLIGTDADRLRERYKRIGEAQSHTFGVGLPGSKPPNFNIDPDQVVTPADPNAPRQPLPGAPATPSGTVATAPPPTARSSAPTVQTAPVAKPIPPQPKPSRPALDPSERRPATPVDPQRPKPLVSAAPLTSSAQVPR